MNNIEIEQQIGERRGQEHDARQAELKVQHGVEVAEALLPLQAASQQRIVDAENLRHAARPASTLHHVQTQTLGRQTGRQRDRQKRRAPAAPLHFQRGMGIFRHRFHREAADLLQRRATDHRAGAAEKSGVPVVVALLHRAVEQRAFVGNGPRRAQVAFEGIGRIEVVRRLQQRQLRIGQEWADGGLQKGARGDVVAVKYADQLAFGDLHGVVQVARFGVAVVVARNIADADVGGENRKLRPLAVIQQIDLQLVARVVDTLRRQHRIAHHVEAFVIGRHVDIDGWPQGDVIRQRFDGAL